MLGGWRTPAVLAAAFAAGIVNGWLGTGGGMLLVLTLSWLCPGKSQAVLALTTACTFCFSAVSILLYALGGHMAEVDPIPILLPSLFGGILGALLLGRTSPTALRGLFAVLLILSGMRLLI